MRSSDRDVVASRCVLALARAEDRMDRALEAALSPVGLSVQKFNALMELAASPEGHLPLSELGRRLIRSAANVTTLVDRLEADGFVRRRLYPCFSPICRNRLRDTSRTFITTSFL